MQIWAQYIATYKSLIMRTTNLFRFVARNDTQEYTTHRHAHSNHTLHIKNVMVHMVHMVQNKSLCYNILH